MSTRNETGIVPDNIWPERDNDFVPDETDQPTRTKNAPASNLRRSGKGEYVGMDMHTTEDDDDYGNVGRSAGAKATDMKGEENRVLGGYKATIHNPRTSEGAKDHARDVLEEHGESV